MHPWKRIRTQIAGTLGLIMGASGVLIASQEIKNVFWKTATLTLGWIAIIFLALLFLALLYLTVRDYANDYDNYTEKLFGIPWLRY